MIVDPQDFLDALDPASFAYSDIIGKKNVLQTWSPTIEFGGASTGITYTLNSGKYITVGNLAFIQIAIVLSNKGSSTGAARIGNLPFVPSSAVQSHCSYAIGSAQNITYSGMMVLYSAPSDPRINFRNMTEIGGIADLDNTNFSNTSLILASGFYWF